MSLLTLQIEQRQHRQDPRDLDRCICGEEWYCLYRERADRAIEGRKPIPGKVLTLV